MKDLVKKMRFLGYFQAIGSLLGIILVVLNIIDDFITIYTFVSLFVFCFSFYCGYHLLSEKYESGLKLSLINQLIQILSFSVFGFSYSYVSGLGLNFIVDVTQDVILNLQINITNFKMSFVDQSTHVSVNLVAIIFMNYIFKWQKKLKSINN
ncbi:hypothetical protein [uncultured Flavobacterium sp.]|uniref:hypothetical protein n=1 Tax=uncultured Flavobacterium sp. TaxID=165435 RepID=UPI0025D3E9D9|nr:hypothetical protein [uncultured Flavobacterium sp.]